jgi:hypothetical protein
MTHRFKSIPRGEFNVYRSVCRKLDLDNRIVSGGILLVQLTFIKSLVYWAIIFPNLSFYLGRYVSSPTLIFDIEPNYPQDFPYAPLFTQTGSLAAIQSSSLLTAAEKVALFTTNAKNLFGSKLHCTYFPMCLMIFLTVRWLCRVIMMDW